MTSPDDNGVDATIAGQRVRITGPNAIVLLVVVGLFFSLGALGVVIYKGFEKLDQREAQRIEEIRLAEKARDMRVDRLSSEHQDISEGLEALIYMLTLPEAERFRLRLERPKKIRELERR